MTIPTIKPIKLSSELYITAVLDSTNEHFQLTENYLKSNVLESVDPFMFSYMS